ncbi:RIB43A-like with coiled-coils protein 2 [Symsagittifera roscoffensis]|uniref:RIB43A-like with coiled-coils protein 2 n=1 Tax=Symsagittifera roscoffensis TaxID=84072 RepID=UPI00307CB501
MYKLDLPIDKKEFEAIEARRQRELQRQSRIFNAKVRTIGIDLQAVQEQERDRRMREEMERRRHEAFANDMIRNDKIAQLLQKRQEADIRRLNKALNEYRNMHQQPNTRREFDLYDPDSLKKDKPARVHDDDPRCTLSSLQKFEGEDLNNPARRKLQQEQMREWSKQQAEERRKAEEKKRRADMLYDKKQIELDNRAMELQKAEMACRKAIVTAQSNYNKALSDEVNNQKELDKRREMDDKLTEIANHVHGDFLTENPNISTSAFGPHRVIPDRWKGMTPEQIAEIRKNQKIQEDERKEREAQQKREDEEWEKQANLHAKAGMVLEREQGRQLRNRNKDVAEENLKLAMEQKAHKEFLDKQVYINPPTAAFFQQFNTITR